MDVSVSWSGIQGDVYNPTPADNLLKAWSAPSAIATAGAGVGGQVGK